MALTTYPIYFRFRDQQRSATVHQYDTHTLVYTSDIEIIRDFGGCIRMEGSNATSFKEAADAVSLHRAIRDQIR